MTILKGFPTIWELFAEGEFDIKDVGIYQYLRSHVRKGKLVTNIKELSGKLRVSEKTISRSLKKLEEHSLIEKTSKRGVRILSIRTVDVRTKNKSEQKQNTKSKERTKEAKKPSNQHRTQHRTKPPSHLSEVVSELGTQAPENSKQNLRPLNISSSPKGKEEITCGGVPLEAAPPTCKYPDKASGPSFFEAAFCAFDVMEEEQREQRFKELCERREARRKHDRWG